ncbi:hypothetical protein COR50_15330 [Chitinophaga caeni]|uniref:Membrane receptor RagA n=1 Tax=Chitinophaga caeni TaxID=2029983 RepID=A0A291QX13_9BACT|nr:DUF5686 and carboxypeptidase regulatory-like domain-containing protein [Chitinophaga caeni]ATL48422.1 hypothetical protein COR50_15330 [Chitinophaga caeni]
MRIISVITLFLLIGNVSQASTIHGKITDEQNNPLAFATVYLKGTTNGTTTNMSGEYVLDVSPGSYTIVCQYMGYQKQEKAITVVNNDLELNIVLKPLSMQIKEVVIKSGGEDPAYEIIRQAIKKREFYLNQVNAYTCESYIKNQLKLKGVPRKVFGQKIDKGDLGVDSSGKGIVFLSESVTQVAYQEPNKLKLEVISDRVSGGDGYGISFPMFINFYEANVQPLSSQLNPRGFISPIANNALFYYKYRLEGTFIEDGKTVNKILVIPRRKFEPLFSGYIFITDDDWRIHSTDLMLTKDYQLELIDSLEIKQTHIPVEAGTWRIKDQVLTFTLHQFGFNLGGTFVNVYSKYNLHPTFKKGYFNQTLMKYDSASQKRSMAYWDTIRPVPLEKEEVEDFRKKDSISRAMKDSANLRKNIDSLKAKQGHVKFTDIIWGGVTRRHYFMDDTVVAQHTFNIKGLAKSLQYNTVEGIVPRIVSNMSFNLGKGRSLVSQTELRYGISNQHFNGNAYFAYSGLKPGRNTNARNTWSFGGGKRVSQFNKANPIDPLTNEFYTLLFKDNYMKLYENWFGFLGFQRAWTSSLRLSSTLLYEDRLPLQNTTDFVIFKNDKKSFTPNHPEDLADIPFERSQAVIFNVNASYQPGQRFIEFPTGKVPLGSKYPTFSVSYSKGIKDVLGSDVDYDKWNFSVTDNLNFKLFGMFKYRVTTGGFFNDNAYTIPDMQHFNGNQTFYNINYLNSFQLAPYYKYSNTASLYGMLNVEHHFNGLLTNKIPLFNRLKWNLVAGSNIFYVNKDNQYYEVFAGLENILKIFRVDVVAGYQSDSPTRVGVRVGLGGLLGGNIQVR